MEENNNKKSGMTKKQIVIGVAVAIACMVGYHKYQSFSVKDAAKERVIAGAKSLKDKAHDKIAGMKDKYHEHEDAAGAATVAVDNRNMGENKFIEVKEDNGLITLNKISVSAKNADLFLLSAVQAGDLVKVKSYVEQGINLNFTNNKLCVQSGDDSNVNDLPANIEQLKNSVRYQGSQGGYTLMTDCSKLFILESVKSMRAPNGDEEVYTMNNYGFTDEQLGLPDTSPWKQQYLKAKQGDLDKIKLEQNQEDVFNYLMDHTDFFKNSNYQQLPYVYRNKKAPMSVRIKALKAYLDVVSNPARIVHVANVDAYNKLADELIDSVAQGAQANSYNAQITGQLKNEASAVKKSTSILDSDFKAFVTEFVNAGGTYVSILNDLANPENGGRVLARNGVKYQSELELSLSALKENGISYRKDRQDMLLYTKQGFGNGFYHVEQVNGMIKIINMMLDSRMVDLNRQYADGSTILHYLADFPNLNNSIEVHGRAIAVLNRYFLNKGANPNLLNKAGQTALEVAMKNNRNAGTLQTYKPILASYQEQNFQK
jgi:hypothetical protein